MYHYYTNPEDNNRVSFAGEHQNGVLNIAASRCSNRDQFQRKKGRAIAEGRLAKGKIYHSIEMSSCSPKEFVDICKLLEDTIKGNPTFLEMAEQPKLLTDGNI